jgi:hypothetical protein
LDDTIKLEGKSYLAQTVETMSKLIQQQES